MRRIKVFLAATALSAVALVGLAPAASAADTVIGNPDGTLISICIGRSPGRLCVIL